MSPSRGAPVISLTKRWWPWWPLVTSSIINWKLSWSLRRGGCPSGGKCCHQSCPIIQPWLCCPTRTTTIHRYCWHLGDPLNDPKLETTCCFIANQEGKTAWHNNVFTVGDGFLLWERHWLHAGASRSGWSSSAGREAVSRSSSDHRRLPGGEHQQRMQSSLGTYRWFSRYVFNQPLVALNPLALSCSWAGAAAAGSWPTACPGARWWGCPRPAGPQRSKPGWRLRMASQRSKRLLTAPAGEGTFEERSNSFTGRSFLDQNWTTGWL